MLRLLMDENFNQRILRGLLVRYPSIDCVIAQQTEIARAKDPALLAWAAEQNRVLVTHDAKTIPKHAYERLVAGLPMPGVSMVLRDLPIGQVIEDLALIALACEPSEVANRVLHLGTDL